MISSLRFFLLAFVCAGLLVGQQDAHRGRLLGLISDPSGAAVPGAKVTISNESTGAVRELESDASGQYTAAALDPGVYTVVVESPGFAPATLRGVVVNVGQSVNLPVALSLEATTIEVNVTASLVDALMPSASAVVDSRAITDLPINGRRFQDFALLTPTVQVDRQRGQLSFVGQRGINANIMVDGADYNQPFFGGIRGGERSNFIITTPQSSVKEFQAVAVGYTAEYGRSSGGVLNVITKGGTNEIHGDAFYLLRHPDLGVEDPFGQKSLEKQHQFGGSVGGPVVKDRAFWFFALERQVAKIPRLVEFPRLAQADRARGPEAFDLYRSFETPFESTNNATALTARGDLSLNSANQLTLRYNFSDAAAKNSVGVGGPTNARINNSLEQEGVEKDRIHFGTAQLTSIVTPAFINEARFTVSTEVRPREANVQRPTVSAGIGNFGSRSFLPTTQDDRRVQFQNTVSLLAGSHSVKLGVDYNRVTAGQSFGFNQFGAFNVGTNDNNTILDVLTPGGQIANRFDFPASRYLRQIGNLLTDLGMHQAAVFAQDAWQITPRFTLNYGMRWEGQYNPEPEATNADLVNRVRSFRFPVGSVDPAVLPDQAAQFMPRLGFAYRPFDSSRSTVLRGGFGLFYASTPLLLYADPMNNFRSTPGNVSIQLPTAGFATVYQQFLAAGIDLNQGPLSSLPIFDIATIQRVAGGGVDPFRGANLTVVGDDYRNPRSAQFNIGLDHELMRNFVVGAQFQHVNTVNLQRNRDFNLPGVFVRDTDARRVPIYGLVGNLQARPIPTLGSVTVRESSARSLYRGTTFSAKHRLRRLQWTAFYTYSQTYSDDDNERSAGGINYVNQYDLRQEYGVSDQDIRHQFTSNAVADLPLGIQLGGIVRLNSGFPINPVAGEDLNGDFNRFNDRGLAAPGQTLARNSFRNRPLRFVDLRVMKNVNFTERTRAQFSLEMFNLFNLNNVIYAGNNTTYGVGVAANGTVTGPDSQFMLLKNPDGSFERNNQQRGTPFQMQIGARFFF